MKVKSDNYIHASEIQKDLGISSRTAYKIVNELNKQILTNNPTEIIIPGNTRRDVYIRNLSTSK